MKSSDGADAAAPPQPIAKPSRPARRPFSRKKLWLFRLTALAVGLMLSFLLAEMLLRVVQREDADGNVTVFGRHVGPVRPPVHRIRETLRQYTETSNSRMIYNPHTGWSARPGRCFRDGRYCYNSAGLRSAPREYSQAPPPGTLRIALFGDSFTHGDDVAWPETWAAQLEAELNQRGVTAEVLNFGLSAAGMDQALLYWQSLGIRYQPHVVLFGFQSENVGRNVNLLRGLYAPGSGIPFSKPRFVLQHDGTIEPVNVPAAPPEQVPGILANLEAWPLARHEWFYRPGPTCPLERWSRVWQLLSTPQPVSRSRWSSRVLYDPNGEPARVTLGILAGFERSVAAAGGTFLIVRMPRQAELERTIAGRTNDSDALWQRVQSRHTAVDPSPAIAAVAEKHGVRPLFLPHYAEPAGAAIAAFLADELQSRSLVAP